MSVKSDVSIVMPCLNEAASLGHCVEKARAALVLIAERYGLSGEVVVADNGSTDGSQALATRLGARLVTVERRGYGAALQAGFAAAEGRFLVMGDADGSYDFLESAPMIGALLDGADICMGSRFKGGIMPGAMPWKNQHIGNPVLTGLLNLLFGTRVDDAHCGLRALTKAAFERLQLTGAGMEFASEMVVKAALLKLVVAETPVILHPDLRGRPPHLRPWRDGWRHLRYLLMLSPGWLFVLPAVCGAIFALTVLFTALGFMLAGRREASFFGDYWVVLAGGMLSLSHMSLLMGLGAQLYGQARGYRLPGRWVRRAGGLLSVEGMLVSGTAVAAIGAAILSVIAAYWSMKGFRAIGGVMWPVVGTTLLAIGVQNGLGGFLLALIGETADAAAEPSSESATANSGRRAA
jgi:glycosyltransferase involved in cell wall biosynthesis